MSGAPRYGFDCSILGMLRDRHIHAMVHRVSTGIVNADSRHQFRQS